MTEYPMPRVRDIGCRKGGDRVWTELLEAAHFWRSQGAPCRVISQMVADDYGVALDEDTVRRLLDGCVATRPPARS